MSARTWRLFVGPVVWAVHFFAIYASTAIVCARAAAGSASVVAVVGGASLVAAAILAWTIVASARDGAEAAPRQVFVRRLTMVTAGLALLAVVFETLPVVLIPPCR
jgi:hypothetical protein